ncbi:MAG: hypothetical protein AAFX92_06105 [Pseudomonadota bacterium]
MEDLGDVTISGLAPGELLQWDGAAWVNQTFAEMNIALTDAANLFTAAQTINIGNNAAAVIARWQFQNDGDATRVLQLFSPADTSGIGGAFRYQTSNAVEFQVDSTTVLSLQENAKVLIPVDTTIEGGVVIGTPTDGNKGAGTINAEAVYVQGALLQDGADGAAGPKGDTGPQGPAGADGAQGPQGIQGPAGNDGADGATGATGPAGALGDQGPQGIQGIQGPAGNDGAAGADGADGKTVLNGTGNPTGGVGVDGDFYINTTSDQIFGPKTGGAWGAGTPLVGPQGTQGDQGPQGLQGLAGNDGADGAQGPQGIQGPAGNDGAAGTDGADGKTVLNGSADPTGGVGVDGDFYINTTSDTIFGPKAAGAWGIGTSLVGPQGPAGADGAQGPAGADGAAGTQGPPGPTGPIGPAASDDAFLAATFGATTTFALNTSDNHRVTVTGNTTLDASGLTEGQAGGIVLEFSGGPHTVSFAAKWIDPPDIPPDANQNHWLVYQVRSGAEILVGLANSYP